MDLVASGPDDGAMATFALSPAQQDELRTAARQAAGMPLAELTPESFPLPTAAAVARWFIRTRSTRFELRARNGGGMRVVAIC